jgi:hypothetical protein
LDALAYKKKMAEFDFYGSVGDLLGVQYLGNAQRFCEVKGIVFGQSKRLMLNLRCKLKPTDDWINVFFLVDTGSPYTYLTTSAMNKLVGNANNVCNVFVHDEAMCIECHLSPQDEYVNVLGMEALSRLGFSHWHIDFNSNTFTLR